MSNQTIIDAIVKKWMDNNDNPIHKAKEYVKMFPTYLEFRAVDGGGALFLGDFESYEFLKSFNVKCSEDSSPFIYRAFVRKALLRIASFA